MAHKQVANHGRIDYDGASRRSHAVEFFSGLAQDPRIGEKAWQALLRLGEDIYATTFTGDSDYRPGALNLSSALDGQPSLLRRDLLKYINDRGNYIVKQHVQDYVQQHHLKTFN